MLKLLSLLSLIVCLWFIALSSNAQVSPPRNMFSPEYSACLDQQAAHQRKIPSVKLATAAGGQEDMLDIAGANEMTIFYFTIIPKNGKNYRGEPDSALHKSLSYINKQLEAITKDIPVKKVLVAIYNKVENKNDLEELKQAKNNYSQFDQVLLDELIIPKDKRAEKEYRIQASGSLFTNTGLDYDTWQYGGAQVYLVAKNGEVIFDGLGYQFAPNTKQVYSMLRDVLKLYQAKISHSNAGNPSLQNIPIVSLASGEMPLSSLLQRNEISVLFFSSLSREDNSSRTAYNLGYGTYYDFLNKVKPMAKVLEKHGVGLYVFNQGFFSWAGFQSLKTPYYEKKLDSLLDIIFLDNTSVFPVNNIWDTIYMKNGAEKKDPSLLYNFLRKNDLYYSDMSVPSYEKLKKYEQLAWTFIVDRNGRVLSYAPNFAVDPIRLLEIKMTL